MAKIASIDFDKFIKANYLELTMGAIALKLNKSKYFVQCRIKKLKLIIPPEILQQRKELTHFRLGLIPANKGKKQSEYMTAEAIEKTKNTRFKKGLIPHNTKEIGYQRVTKDGYIEVRVESAREYSNFVLLQRKIYEEHFNIKLKSSEIISFKDGNKRNFDINNLEKISHEENLRRNSIHNYPEPVREIIRLKAKLNNKINKLNSK